MAAACVALAAGGIVLLKAEGRARAPDAEPPGADAPEDTGTGDSAPAVAFDGPGLQGQVALTQGAVAVGEDRRIFAELRLEADRSNGAPRPVALAVVLDTSGSMQGNKIAEARSAVVELIDRMKARDRIALVTYDMTPTLFQALTPVGTIREELRARAAAIRASGGTDIPAALALGAETLAPAPERFVRRLVLVSDGIDGSGVALRDVSSRVRSRADRGVTTSSLGVGTDYDEEFLGSVADAGRGNYEFLRHGRQLAHFLSRELQEAASIVVEDAVAEVVLPDGWRLRRAFGAEVRGSRAVEVPLGSLHASERRRVLLELEVDAAEEGPLGELALDLAYRTSDDRAAHELAGKLPLRAVADETMAHRSRDTTRHAEALTTVIDADQREALRAWRSGKDDVAVQIGKRNVARMKRVQAQAPSPTAAARLTEFEQDVEGFATEDATAEESKAYRLERNAARRGRARTY